MALNQIHSAREEVKLLTVVASRFILLMMMMMMMKSLKKYS